LRTTGYQRLTVDQICRVAGASKGAFYLYFPSKRALLLALIDEQTRTFERLIAALSERNRTKPTGGLNGSAPIARFISSQLRLASDSGQSQLRADLWGIAAADSAVRVYLSAAYRQRRALLRAYLEEGVAAGTVDVEPDLANALAASLLALTDGLVVHNTLDPSAFKWRNVQRLLATAPISL
jgi:AcrR family transcriptional regulator